MWTKNRHVLFLHLSSLCLCLSVCPSSFSVSLCLFLSLCLCLPVCLFLSLSVLCLSVCPSLTFSLRVCLFLLSVTCRSLSRCLSISLHHFLSLSLSVYLPTCGLDLFSEDVRGGSGFLSIVVTHLTFIVDEKQYNNGFSFDGPTLWARSALCLGLIFLLSG